MKTTKPAPFVPFVRAKKNPNGGVDLKPFVKAINKLSREGKVGVKFTLKQRGVNVQLVAQKGRRKPVVAVAVANNYAALNRFLGIMAGLKLVAA